jgi:hypothetical protein
MKPDLKDCEVPFHELACFRIGGRDYAGNNY